MEEETRAEKAERLAARLAEARAEKEKNNTRENDDPEHTIQLLSIPKRDFLYEEAIKTLRTNLQFSGSSVKVILFTSCIPSEGKSVTTFEVARSLASIDKKAVYIDADLRKSIFVKRYSVKSRTRGLSQYLSGQCGLEDIFYHTNIDNLDVVLAGPYAPNPAELLEEELFDEFIAHARQLYDYVIIDSPPMANIIDGAIMARLCDGAVIVIKSGAVSYRGDQRVKEQIEKSGCRLLGAVLNQVDVDKSSRGGYYYNHYYSNYYGVRHTKSRKKS